MGGWIDKLTGKDSDTTPQMSPVSGTSTSSVLDDLNTEYLQKRNQLLDLQMDQIKNPIDPTKSAFMTEDFSVKNLLGDRYAMGNMIGLAGTLMQAASLPSMLKNAKLQNESLKFNLDTAKQEQGRRNKNISAFNAFRG